MDAVASLNPRTKDGKSDKLKRSIDASIVQPETDPLGAFVPFWLLPSICIGGMTVLFLTVKGILFLFES